MADPTKAELFNQLAHVTTIIEHVYEAGGVDGTNLKDLIDSFEQKLEGNQNFSILSALNGIRSTYGSVIDFAPTLISPIITDLARIGYNSVETDVDAQISDIYDGMVTASENIVSRAFSFDSTINVGGSNVGTGTVYRVTVDENAEPIETGLPGTVNIDILRDRQSGTNPGNEVARIYGSGKVPFDQVDLGNTTAAIGELTAVRAEDSLLQNPSFKDFAGTEASPTAITGWTLNSGTFANIAIDSTNFYRTNAGVTTGQAMKFKATDILKQKFSVNSIVVDPTLPVFLIVRYNRAVDGFSGTLRIDLGAVNESVTLAAQTGWNALTLGVDLSGTSKNGWMSNFNENDVEIDINVTRTGGTLLVDDVILVQPTIFDGRFYLLTSAGDQGSDADFLRDDTFNFADTATDGATANIQYWIARAFGRYLPNQTAGTTYSSTPS